MDAIIIIFLLNAYKRRTCTMSYVISKIEKKKLMHNMT